MAWDIPSPTETGNGLLKGFETGSQMMNRIIQNKIAQQTENRQQSLVPSEIELRQAQARQSLAHAASAASENSMAPLKTELIKAKIASEKELAKMRSLGGGTGTGAGLKEIMGITRQIMMDNPGMDMGKANQIASAYLSGSDKLPNGEQVPEASGITRSLLDQNKKRGTTAALITKGVLANQAHTEIGVLSDFTQKALAPYGNTYDGYSPSEIMDSFKNDEKSQKQLGRFIAAQQLQYEIAQNEIKVAGGETGITQTQELMNLGQQLIKAKYPKLSYAARQEANRYFLEALSAGLKARNKLGINAAFATGNNNNAEQKKQPALIWNPEKGDFEEEK